jgi:beta-galactosidase
MRLFKRLSFVNISAALIFCCFFNNLAAQTTNEQITERTSQLEALISSAEGQGIDVKKEKMTLRTAEIFIEFAAWDENNVSINKSYFEMVSGNYMANAQLYAQELPELIRTNIVLILDEAIERLNLLLDGVITRRPVPEIDWDEVSLNGDVIQIGSHPVFISDYTWKPQIPLLTEFYGDMDGFNLRPGMVQNAQGNVSPAIISELESKLDENIGYVFFNNGNVPQWAEDLYGPGFKMREHTYIQYDIDNPGARELWGHLLEATVPLMAGKKYSELGYMLVNEPHFYTTKDVWATGPVSDYTIEKFKIWLSQKHGSISDLNQLWGSSFSDFNQVTIEIPINANLQGTPKWYDWVTFNNYRVTEWYKWKKSEVQKHDPEGKIHLKIMPNLWTENSRNHGIDFEALTEISEISGNDAGAENSYLWGGPKPWEDHYSWDWREVCMSYDFMKSVNPGNIIYNTETHFLSKVAFRDRNLDPDYVRAVFWTAHVHGLNANLIWVWGRNTNGSVQNRVGKGYAGSLIQQPRVVNEIQATQMDLNSFAEEITAFQRQKKPIRIFYSETSATNKPEHMDDVFEIYESLFFDGIPIGFASRNILNNQDHASWEVVLVHKTQFVTQDELDALQAYLDNGGTVIIDNVSLGKNEYGSPLNSLVAGEGTLIQVNSLNDMRDEALGLITPTGYMPEIEIIETNTGGHKGCNWRAVKNDEGNTVLSVINNGKTDASLEIRLKNALIGTSCIDLLTGVPVTNKPILKPYEVYFVEVIDEESTVSTADFPIQNNSRDEKIATLYPNPTSGKFSIKMNEFHNQIHMSIMTLSGEKIFSRRFLATREISHSLENNPAGVYIINLITDKGSHSFIQLKR